MTICSVCEVTDFGTKEVHVNGELVEICANCSAENAVAELDGHGWLDEIEACDD